MDTAAPRPILLEDYKPPNYLIDTVSLDVALDPERTRVRSRLQMRANPDYPGKPGALKLDGELLALEKVAIDGRELGSRRLPGDGPQPRRSPRCRPAPSSWRSSRSAIRRPMRR